MRTIREILCNESTDPSKYVELKNENERLKRKVEELEEEKHRLTQKHTISTDVETETREKSDLAHELRSESWFSEIDYWWPMNANYKTPVADDFREACREIEIDEKTYTTDFFDCVDFTTGLRSEFAIEYEINSIGQIITREGSPHAFNVVYTADEGLILWEPQSNKEIEANESDLYQMEDSVVHV